MLTDDSQGLAIAQAFLAATSDYDMAEITNIRPSFGKWSRANWAAAVWNHGKASGA